MLVEDFLELQNLNVDDIMGIIDRTWKEKIESNSYLSKMISIENSLSSC
jgi:hypothetical protein